MDEVSCFAIAQACYTNSTEVLFAVMTIYHLRVIERLWGSRKFLVCYIDPSSNDKDRGVFSLTELKVIPHLHPPLYCPATAIPPCASSTPPFSESSELLTSGANTSAVRSTGSISRHHPERIQIQNRHVFRDVKREPFRNTPDG